MSIPYTYIKAVLSCGHKLCGPFDRIRPISVCPVCGKVVSPSKTTLFVNCYEDYDAYWDIDCREWRPKDET